MKITAVFCLLALLFCDIGYCDMNKKNSKHPIEDISASEALKMLKDSRTAKKLTIVDIRTREEYLSGHISGAVNIDFYSKNFEEELNKLEKDRVYLIYCRTDRRSSAAIKMMRILGFKRVYRLKGGFAQLQKSSLWKKYFKK